ncbi:hypothetical protein BBJ29_003396 [Phytophthora kernoviae]|uniref:Uncharacterized protein n=1 Tax=Phytophthora kernoviae TaxID=325452 RepID=A0A421G0M0_9STRA|nr:hypothetical protein BBJ29_003396 [Phytophthora kernoviae]
MTRNQQAEAEAAMATLKLQVRALRRYKINYKLLCSQLSELNAQIGLQLQRHEADVAALQASIADLQTEKLVFEARASEAEQALTVQREAARQDTEYSEHVHRQLSSATEILKATEKRLEDQEMHFTAEIDHLKEQFAASNEECAEYQASAKELEEDLEALRMRVIATKEQDAIRRQRDKSKHKKELTARATKLRSLTDELETLRSAMRATKKQVGHIQADNDALRKQLVNMKRDGAHLSDISDRQSNEHGMYVKQLALLKKEKKKLANHVAQLSQEVDQLDNELSDTREKLVERNSELEACRIELRDVRNEVQQGSHALSDAHSANAELVKQVESLQKAEDEQLINVMADGQELRANREQRYRKEVVRTRKLLADNKQRVAESSQDWADIMRNSITAERSAFKNGIMEQIRVFGA